MVLTHAFGTTPDGTPVRAFELSCAHAAVRVSDFGATLLGVTVPDRDGQPADVVLGFGSLEGYLDDPACFGATIGPVANRTDKGEVPLAGHVWQLPQNDGPERRNNLHTSLDAGLHKRVWTAETSEGDEPSAASSVTLTTTLADGELGLPGNRTFTATYELADTDVAATLTVRYRCETDAPTYVSMTNHSYFNLAGHTSGDVLAQHLAVRASRYLPLREDSVSTGEVRDVAGTPFDFRKAKPIGRDIHASDPQLAIAHGYDHCLAVDGYQPGASPRPALHAEDPATGRALDIRVTTPGAHLYTGNWLGDEHAKDNASYHAHSGFAFEPEFWPDVIHHPAWEQPVCEPGHPYEQTIVYRFSTI